MTPKGAFSNSVDFSAAECGAWSVAMQSITPACVYGLWGQVNFYLPIRPQSPCNLNTSAVSGESRRPAAGCFSLRSLKHPKT